MKFLSNAHTHTPWCDGKSSILEMLERAKTLGFVSLGFSGHAGQGFDPLYSMMDGRQEQYRLELRALQVEYIGKAPRIWAGLELDAFASDEWRRDAYEHFDYVIGSTHYLCADYHGEPVGVDGNPTTLKRYVDDVFSGDGLAMAKAYYDIHVGALLRDQPAIIGHFDLVRKYSGTLSLFDEYGEAYRKLALDALERSYHCGAVLEINTGGIARGYASRVHPNEELLGAWHEMGGDVTITSDCHDAKYLDCWFDEAMKLCKRIGFPHVLRLGTGQELWEQVSLK